MSPRAFVVVFSLSILLQGGLAPAAGNTTGERTVEMVAREVIEAAGGARVGMQVIQQMIPVLKKSAPEVPDVFWTRFMEEVRYEELVEMTVPIYAKHFSKSDLEALLLFYRSPVGQRVLAEMPAVMQECMVAGGEWGQRVAQRAIERAREYEEDGDDEDAAASPGDEE